MKKIHTMVKSSTMLLLFALCISSCSKKSEQVNYIPKDANMVLAVDIKSIGMKTLDFKEIFSLNTIKKKFNSAEAKDNATEKLKNSGIDLLNTAYFFGQANEDMKGYGALTVALSDGAKFESFVKELDNFTIANEGEYNFATKANEKGIIAWNKTSAIFLFENSITENSKEKVLSFFTLKKEDMLSGTDKNFQELQNKSADISFWINFEKLGNLASSAYGSSVGAINLKEAFLTAVCNFEKGEIVIDTKYHANKGTAEKLSLIKESMSKDIVNALPGKSVMSMLGLSLDMDKLYAYLEKENLISNVEENAKQTTGFSAKEVFKLLSGEFAGTINGVQMKEVEDMDGRTGEKIMVKEPMPVYSIVIGINEKDKAAKLFQKFTEEKMLLKKDNYYSFQDRLFIADKGSFIVVSGTEVESKLNAEGNGEKLNTSLSDLLTGNAGVFYLNFSNIPAELLDMAGKTTKDYIKISQLEALTITGSSIKENVSEGKIVIGFKQKEENSLVTLAKISDKLAEEDALTEKSEEPAN